MSRQLIRALRGNRSQVAFARRLGYRGNPVTTWERGERFPSAREVLRAAGRAGINVQAAFERFHTGPAPSSDEHGPILGPWMRDLAGNLSVTELARRIGCSRSSVSRWLSDKAHPRIFEFLQFVDAATGRVPDLVAQLVPIDRVPALQARYQVAQAAKRLAFDEPWTEAIVRFIETLRYAQAPTHDGQWIAQCLALDQETVERCLAHLLKLELVQFDGQKYSPQQELTVDTRGGKEQLHALKSHWSCVAAERARTPSPQDAFAYNVFSASTADMEHIRNILRTAYREIRAVVSGSEPAEQVALVNLNLVAWSEEQARATSQKSEDRAPRSLVENQQVSPTSPTKVG